MYHISPDVVASALKIPRVAHPRYPYTGKLIPLPDTMMELFCGKTIEQGRKKKSNPTTEFTCEACLFNLVMSHNLLPVSHRNTVSLRQAQFLYAFMTGISIDLQSVICGEGHVQMGKNTGNGTQMDQRKHGIFSMVHGN